LKIEVHLFGCGQGDTILLNLDDRTWILIDCYLPQGPVRQAFFDLVNRLGIKRLEAICLTHPHEDHFWGMPDVIEYFMSNGRSVGTFCDSGTTAKEILTLMNRRRRPKSSVREFERLDSLLTTLHAKGLIRYFRADANSRPLIETTGADGFALLPIGPPPNVLKQSVRGAIVEGRIRDDLNLTSVIFVLRANRAQRSFTALLAADTNALMLKNALFKFQEVEKLERVCFDFVKVPHHGSWDSHEGSNVCACRHETKPAVAGISVGSDYDVLPDRKVLEEFLEKAWIVLLTTKRTFPRPRNYVLELANRAPQAVLLETNTVVCAWDSAKGLTWGPPQAQLFPSELASYGTAAKTTQGKPQINQ
jgi:beta-lactamase superfamily II metal-dependent hydrolase